MTTAKAFPLPAKIIAHRGASYLAPENTLASVALGYAEGADAVEIDVQLSQDKQLVVIHDKSTLRTAGGVHLLVAETPCARLRQLDVGSWKEADYKGERIPLLQEVLALVPEQKKLVIELKCGPESLPFLQQLLAACSIVNQLVFISFNQEVILEVKHLFPNISAFWLLHNWASVNADEAIRIACESQLDGLNVHYTLVTSAFMKKIQQNGLNVYAYTVNDVNCAQRLLDLGVKGITTDRPKWLRDQLQTAKTTTQK